ncbi:MAG: hypothetical protein ACFE9S_06540 [Candidatus Hermodarchaeota archaeon]
MSEKIYNFCPYCGRKLPKSKDYKAVYCCYCGKKLQVKRDNLMKNVQCIICHRIVDPNRHKNIKCPYCGSMYHLTCVSSWLLKYNACPMCQNVFLFPNKIIPIRK